MSQPKSITLEVLRLEALVAAAERNPTRQYNQAQYTGGLINPLHFDFEAYLAQNIVDDLKKLGFSNDVGYYQKRIDAVYEKAQPTRTQVRRVGW